MMIADKRTVLGLRRVDVECIYEILWEHEERNVLQPRPGSNSH